MAADTLVHLPSPDSVDVALADYLRDHGLIGGLRAIDRDDLGATLVPGRPWSTDEGFSRPGRSIRLYGCLRDYHRAESRRTQELHIADPVTISLRRLLGGIGVVTLAITECRPPQCLRAGPVLRDSASAKVVKMSVGVSELSATHQVSDLPCLRYRLVGCSLLLREPMDREQFLAKAEGSDQIIVAREEFGFTGPATLADYFADIGYGKGHFAETVLFDGAITISGMLLFFTFAVDELAGGPELLDALLSWERARRGDPAQCAWRSRPPEMIP
jgi:hypothetical protein